MWFFAYSPTQKVLNGVSFEIKEGETIAFVSADWLRQIDRLNDSALPRSAAGTHS